MSGDDNLISHKIFIGMLSHQQYMCTASFGAYGLSPSKASCISLINIDSIYTSRLFVNCLFAVNS